MTDEPLIDIPAAAAFLGCSTKTVRRLYWRGELECVRVGSLVRFRPSALRSYLDRPVARPSSFEEAWASLTYDAT